MTINILQNMSLAISVMRSAGRWFEETGKNPSKWRQLNKKIIDKQLLSEKVKLII